GPKRAHDFAGRLKTRLDENGTEQCLEGVGEDGVLLAPAALGLAVAQDEMRAHPDLPGDGRARLSTDQPVVAARKLTLCRIGMVLVQQLCNREPEHAISDEFQALVVHARATL